MKLFFMAFQPQRVIICALAGLLVFYHTFTLYDLYLGSGSDLYEAGSRKSHSLFEYVQSFLRVAIIISLLLVISDMKIALYGMWAAISALVASHYWALFLNLPFQFLNGRHPLSYIKGFIIPSIVTLLFLSIRSQRNSGKGA